MQLDAIAATRPRIVVCWAPAGFGKSVLASQIIAQAGASGVVTIDAAGAGDAAAFARAVLAACEPESASLPLHGADDAAAALDAWRRCADPQTVYLFENVDALDATARALLAACLEDLGTRGLVVMCSRAAVDVPFSRSLRPTDVLVLGEPDLRFTRGEIADLFGERVDESTLDRIERLTEGWPLALGLLHHAAQVGPLDRLLRELDDVEHGRLGTYLEADVIASLDDTAMDVVCLLTLVEEIDTHGAAAALRIPIDRARAVLRGLPFVQRTERSYRLHPLIVSHVFHNHAARRALVAARAVRALRETHDDLLAARIAFAVGDTEGAAGALDEMVAAPPELRDHVADLAQALDGATLMRFPRLWVMAMPHRIYATSLEQWRLEASALWASLADDCAEDIVVGVGAALGMVLGFEGLWDDYDEMLLELSQRFVAIDPPSPARLLEYALRVWRGVIDLELLDVDRLRATLAPLEATDYLYVAALCFLVAPAYANAGDRESERETLARAIAVAENGIPSVWAFALQQAAIAAWLAGEDDLFRSLVHVLQALADHDGGIQRGMAHFLRCTSGDGLGTLPDNEGSATRALSLLIAAAATPNATIRRSTLDGALAAADASRHAGPRILARLAISVADPSQQQLLEEARALMTPLSRDSLYGRYLAARPGDEPLEPFLRRYRSVQVPTGTVLVQLLQGAVWTETRQVPLSHREFALFAHIALQPRAIDVDALADRLWPDASAEAGLASVRVYVNRIRKRIGDAEVIASTRGAYGRGPSVRTDVELAERFVASLPSATNDEIVSALELRAALRTGPPAWLLDLPGFETLHGRLGALLERLDAALERRAAGLTPALRDAVRAALDADD
ncbi:MAG TPA: AAA family ATPase [Candidatus Sulfotelmatobacter sp.]|nr:AAA family ATPase [Candidatus Sulfotelmatobacter sp.]